MSADSTATGSSTGKPAKKEVPAKAAAPRGGSSEPVIIDLGKKTRKQVRKLRKGKSGRLLDRIEDSIEHLRENGAIGADAQPIVVIVKERRRTRGRRFTKALGLG